MTCEAWRPVAGFDGYEVSDLGNVRSLPRRNLQGAMRRGRVLKPNRFTGGYLKVHPFRAGVKESQTIHRLVLTAFGGSAPSPLHQVRHKNGVPNDNRAENLEWGTAAENAADRKKHGTDPGGARNPRAKLTEVDIERVNDLRRQGRTLVQIGAWLGVNHTLVSMITRKKHYLAASPS